VATSLSFASRILTYRGNGDKHDQLPWDMTEPRLEEEAQVCNNMAAALNHGCVVEKTKALSSIGRGGGSGGGEGDVSIYCGVSVLLMHLIKTHY